jgi:peptidoglycan/LPS O-acetylase OafA/YrhL
MENGKKINSLQGLRFVAFLAVFVLHISTLYKTINYATIAVSLFFIISGFVSCISINKYKNNFHDMLLYLKTKLKRLYPLYIISILIYLPVSLSMIFKYGVISIGKYIFSFVASVLLLQSWIPNSKYITIVANAGWFLSALMFLYLITIPLHKFISNINKKNKVSTNIIIILCSLLMIVAYHYVVPKSGYLHYYFPIYRIFEYIIGIVLWNIFVEIKKHNISSIIVSTLEIISILVLGVMPFLKVIYVDYLFVAMNTILLLSIVLGNGLVGKLLSNKLLVWLGNISFEMYLLHFPILIYTFFIWDKIMPTAIITILLYVLVSLLLTIMISYIIHYKLGGLVMYGKTAKNK